jgi:hypothetical protein
MKENKKNIERLFQEKFKDFEATPPLESWKNIEERLNQKKKKRRVIPFWFKTSGIAATLILGVFLFMNKKDNLNNNINEVVIDNNSISNAKNTSVNSSNKKEVLSEGLIKEENGINTLSDKENKEVVFQNKSNKEENPSVNKNTLSKSKTTNLLKTKQQIIVSNSEKLIVKNKKNKTARNNIGLSTNNTRLNENVVVTNSKNPIELNEEKNSNNLKAEFIVASNNKRDSNNNLNLSPNELKNNTQNLTVKETLDINKNNAGLPTNNTVVVNSNKVANQNIIANSLNSNNIVFDSVALVQNNIITNVIQDSALVAEVNAEENPLEKLLKEKLEGKNVDEKEKEKRNKWAASTYASPVYFNSTAQGSPIDDQFKETSKSYKSTLSYGLGLEYAVSKKLSIKTGVNTLTFNYSTSDVSYATSLQSVTGNVKTITRNNNGENLVLEHKIKKFEEANVENLVQNNEGSLNQEMGYIEVPLELNYKVLDRKFGINLVGGMSTLFLSANTVSLISNQAETTIGSANNLNNIHFSSNVGLGFKYTFWKSFQANFQPMFKYQINTFSNDSGNFKPYFVGLYSGVSFSF